ncbi:MAG TPA: efflux RND transporter permease subunit [Candidatus Acidoferrales bacterium]|jgi:Cu(I)/Ag(I) efflux system membrane protein CusA/SilA|nr:efflux RND transporter permease subunit [Candidatus Acidoferrales bacterium]
MIARLIQWCTRNVFLIFTATVLLVAAGVWAMRRIPLDALPDISDVEVIIYTPWAGEPPNIIEDQVTYPIVTTLLAAPHVKAVRAQTMFGDSYVFVIFQDGTDLYWARSRVLEYLQEIQGELPAGVHPVLGPDATGAGWVYEYVLVDHTHKYSLADLRSLQDWYLRYQLETVPGVAEVATIGGFVRQYQVNLDPDKLRAYNIPLSTVIDRVRASTNEVGGRLLELGGAEYMIRGLGYFRSLDDLRNVPVATQNGTPVLVSDLGTVSFGPDIRRGVAEWNGEGETVGGIVVMRYGENALNVINGVKAKIAAIAPSLPPGVEIRAGYDRSGLIYASIHTLERDLIEEAIVVSLVIIIFLWHFRSALIPILTIPIAVVASFIPMFYLHVSSNIMSLGGLALAIGVLVDAGIVMVENGYRHLAEREALSPLPKYLPSANPEPGVTQPSDESPVVAPPTSEKQRRQILIVAAQQVGPALFFSLVIIVVSFLPVFLLEAQEGRMFSPLAWTKTLAIAFSSVLAITLVPVLMPLFIRGRLRPESKNPVSRVTQAIYLPVLRLCLRFRKTTVLVALLMLALTVPLAQRIGSQFMPPLFEGSSLYMPTALPGISITQASQLLQEQDRIIRKFPEVETVFGTVGRSNSATDNAPLDMYDTTIMLKPRSKWPAGMTYEKLIQQMDGKLQFPGLTNTWTMPIENRLDMELTGIKTPVGMKIQGPSLDGIQQVGARIGDILSGQPGVQSVFAERVAQGFYINIAVNRPVAARYGLDVADVQRAIESGIGGENIAENIEGRDRYPINVRYNRDFRDDIPELERVVISTPSGAQIPISEVATISFSRGPSMIRDEEAQLTGYVYFNLSTSDYGGFVASANQLLREKLKLPAGYTYTWSGEYEFELRAKKRLELILPIVFFVIFLLLYMTFHSVAEAAMLFFPAFFALIGGLLLQLLLGYNFSVAVAVGYIDLFGIAVETAVVMIVYLHEALDLRLARGIPLERDDIEAATIDGAVLRLRPKLMTVFAVIGSLGPLLWETGISSDVMKPIAAPIVGGMVTSTIAVMILVPILFAMLKERALRKGTLHPSASASNE